MTDTIITGPANALDLGILRAWLDQPVHSDTGTTTQADSLGLDVEGLLGLHELTSSLDDLLTALRDDDEQDAWKVDGEIECIDIRRTYDGDGHDGVDVHVNLLSGVRLGSLRQDYKALTGGAEDSIEAIVNAVATVARQANEIVRKYREVIGAQVNAELTDREVFIALPAEGFQPAEQALAALEEALGQRSGSLRIRKLSVDELEPLVGVRLDRQFDLDAAVAHAREAGLRYVETRETTYDSGRNTDA